MTNPSGTVFSALTQPVHWRLDGVSRKAVRNALRDGDLVRVSRGVVVHSPSGSPDADLETRVRAAQLRWPTSVVSHATAARLHNIPFFTAPEHSDDIHLTVWDAARRHGGLVIHGLRLSEADVADLNGIRLTTPVRTALDIALDSTPAWATVAFDAVARQLILTESGLTSVDDAEPARALRQSVRDDRWQTFAISTLAKAVEASRRRHGIANARYALDHIDPRAESPLESLSRVGISEANLPTPIPGYEIRTSQHTYWADFAWPEYRLIGEADGQGKYGIPGTLDRQSIRQSELEAAGWQVVRWTWDDVFPNPHPMVSRLATALFGLRYSNQAS